MFWLYILSLAQLNPPEEAMRLGRIALSGGRFEEAVVHYEAARKAAPSHPGVLLNLCIANLSAAHPAQALGFCQKVRGSDPNLAPARLFEGLALLKLNRPAEAIAPLEAFLRVQPRQSTALLELANAYLILGDGEKSLLLFERLQAWEPNNPRAWQGIAISHLRCAEMILERQKPGSATWLAMRGLALLDRGQFKGAFNSLRQAIALDPKLPGVHTALAEIYRRLDHPDWAAIEEAKENASQPSDPAYSKALSHSQEALEAFAQLLRLPPSAELYEVQGSAERARGRYAESVALYEKSLQARPGDSRLEAEFGKALFLAQQYDRALPLLEKHKLYAEAGSALLEQGELSRAIGTLEKAPARGEVLAKLGEAYLRADQPQRAIAPLVSAAPQDRDGRIHLLLARAFQRVGKATEAKAAQQRYQELSQKGDEVAVEITPP